MSIRQWIYERAIRGYSTFSVEELRPDFPSLSAQNIQSGLNYLSRKKVIVSVYRGFYVIIPVQYALRGEVPPIYYVDDLMAFLKKPYYVSLYSAAELLGAAHQRPQAFSITTCFPRPNTSAKKNPVLRWTYRRKIEDGLLLTAKTETSTVKYSCAELTAADLIQYSHKVGGLSRAATIIAELCDVIDEKNLTEKLLGCATITALQRLGYILEEVLQQRGKADAILRLIKSSGRETIPIPLDLKADVADCEINRKWNLLINNDIEPDEI